MPNTTSDLATEISEQLHSTSSKTVPILRKLRREVSRRIKSLQPPEVFALIDGLLSDAATPKWFAYELLHHHPAAMKTLNASRLRRLGRGLSAWYEVDPFACYLSGPAWREGLIGDAVVHRWAASSDRWWRRVAVVSTVALNNTARGGQGDAARTLAVCDLVKGDRDDMVVKAVSWALRELARKKPAVVKQYLRDNAPVLAARVVREVRNKLDFGLKNPRK